LLGYFGSATALLPPYRESQAFIEKMVDAVRPDNVRSVSTIICLWALDMKRADPNRDDALSSAYQVLRLCLRYESISTAIAKAQRGRSAVVSIEQGTEPALWAFLVSCEMENDDGLVLQIGFEKMFRMLAPLTGLPLRIFETETEIGRGQQQISIPLQALYSQIQRMGIRGKRFETIRPFFTDEHLRGRIRPLIVERRPAARR
jgi:hypothetical protein